MAISLFFENELKLMEKQTARLDSENVELRCLVYRSFSSILFTLLLHSLN